MPVNPPPPTPSVAGEDEPERPSKKVKLGKANSDPATLTNLVTAPASSGKPDDAPKKGGTKCANYANCGNVGT